MRQTAYVVARAQKIAALGRILDMEDPTAAIVFCRTRNEVDELAETLHAHGYRAEALHGGMSQEQRDRVMKKLRGKRGRPGDRHRRRGARPRHPAALARGQLRRAVGARGLRAPHRPRRAAPAARASRSRSPSRASTACCATSSSSPSARSRSPPVPTVADLRARRLELDARGSLREVLARASVERFRVVVESLPSEFDAGAGRDGGRQAAVRERAGPEPEEVIPAFAGGSRRAIERGRTAPRPVAHRRAVARGRRAVRRRAPSGRSAGMTRVFIGGGREMGIRPQDIVGAITGEAGISGGEIGVITISDRFSLVEIPEGLAKMVVGALRGRPVKGKKVVVRLERSAADAPARPREPAWGRPARRDDERPARKPPGRGRRYP